MILLKLGGELISLELLVRVEYNDDSDYGPDGDVTISLVNGTCLSYYGDTAKALRWLFDKVLPNWNNSGIRSARVVWNVVDDWKQSLVIAEMIAQREKSNKLTENPQ